VAPKLTIVIPVFDGENFLPRAVECVRRQDLVDSEIVVVDDGSRDRTADVARALAVTLIRQENAGPAAARNRGIRASSSEYVTFLDVDDEWPAGAVGYLLTNLERDRSVDVALGHAQCLVQPDPDSSTEDEHGPPFVSFLLGAAVYRRSVFERVGALDESLREGEDVDWFMRARELGVQIKVYPRTTLRYRRRPGSITYGRAAEGLTLARMLKRSIARRRSTETGDAASLPALEIAGRSAVTVIVAVRNGERFLAEALGSILGGEVVPDEILVVDGGSTDATPRIAETFALVKVVAQEGCGIAAAYNQGIRAARSDLIAFLSHDDRWDPRKLALQIRHLETNAVCDAVVSKVRHFLEPGETPPSGFRSNLLEEDRPAFIVETLLARRRAFERVGVFDPSFSVAEDVDWFARARDAGLRIDVLPEVLVHKRVHSANTSLNAAENDHQLLRAARAAVKRKRS
jgi:glycosyltransferase involved in cell wall biosynthesis